MVLGVLIGTMCSCFIGVIWYHPVFLGNIWMKATHPGKTAQQIEEGFVQSITISILSSGTLALILQCALVNVFHTQSVYEAASIGFGLACLLFLADASHCVFGKRSFLGFVIDHAYDAVIITLMAASIVYFQKHGIEIPFPSIMGSNKKAGL